VDAVVLGRTTYEQILAYGTWPFGTREVVVLTHRPFVPLHGERAHAGALAPLFESLALAGRQHVYLDGGQAVRQGLREGLLQSLTLSVIPTVLGDGRPLFDASVPASAWRTRESRTFPSGLTQMAFERAA
jgi:dihydrofolate reductase